MDNLRYDAAEERVYVGYSDEEDGAIGMLDAVTNKRLDSEFKTRSAPGVIPVGSLGPKHIRKLARLEANCHHQS